MKQAIRTIFLAGIASALLPSLCAFFAGKPPWFGEAVYLTSGYIGFSLVVLWSCTELLSYYFPGRLMGTFLVAVALPAALVPSLDVNWAVFLGRDGADIQTWHLLPLFAAMDQILATVAVGTSVGVVCDGVALVRALRRRRPDNGMEATPWGRADARR